MGGGNAQKSAMARERNAKAKAAASKGSQLKSNQAMLKCKVCMQTFAQGTTKVAFCCFCFIFHLFLTLCFSITES